MKDIIFEIILSVIVIGLLFMAVNVFQSGMGLVSTVSEKTYETEKVDIMIIPEDDAANIDTTRQISGSEVVALIRYYKEWQNISISVKYNNSTKQYYGKLYEDNPFSVPYVDFIGSTFEIDQATSGNMLNLKFNKI